MKNEYEYICVKGASYKYICCVRCGIAKTVAELLFKPTERRIKNQHSRLWGRGPEGLG